MGSLSYYLIEVHLAAIATYIYVYIHHISVFSPNSTSKTAQGTTSEFEVLPQFLNWTEV